MLQKRWFKIFIWFTSSAFFFLSATIIISFFNPGPSEKDVSSYMMGMMSSMHGSTMGLSMTIEGDTFLKHVILTSSKLTLPLIIIGFFCGVLVKIRRLRFVK
jgi:formate hydrogenlyase subunit 3/multisubunit Na+/H+ antiporter MnhD subunit